MSDCTREQTMPSGDGLTSEDLRLLLGCLPALYIAEGLGSYPDRVFAVLKQLVGADSYAYEETVPEEGRALGLVTPEEARPVSMLPTFAAHIGTHPVIGRWMREGPTGAAAISDFVSREALERVPVYAEFYRQVGVEDQLGLLIDFQKPMMVALACNRGGRTFSARDRAILDLLRPHLKAAYSNAAALTRAGLSGAEVEEAATQDAVWVETSGRVEGLTVGARALLGRYFPSWRRRPGELPGEMAAWLRGEGAVMKGRETAGKPAMEMVVARRWGTLRVWLMVNGEREGYVLLLREQGRRTGGVEGLPGRQRELLEHLLAGASAKEAAGRMGLSVHTVNEYVKELYRRFGVSSRGELMARFVRRDE